ncbi:MAG TPA: CHRD domain-containing protein [Casimicrobiaceae bacterium]|nr:CHRD domain-containing protein [Casimicrobiaceae bacterium]
MKLKLSRREAIAALTMIAAAGVLAACSADMGMMHGMSSEQHINLTGASEVPAVSTSASGSGTVTISPDRSVSAKISVSGMTATASHIHQGAAGTNGPVIVPFTKTGDNTFAAPEGAKLTEAQYAAYKAGDLYVNVHSAAHPGGEVRAQLKGN